MHTPAGESMQTQVKLPRAGIDVVYTQYGRLFAVTHNVLFDPVPAESAIHHFSQTIIVQPTG